MIPFFLTLIFSILPTLVFVVPGLILFRRWNEIIKTDEFDNGDMKVPTFYSMENDEGVGLAVVILFPVVGVVFGGIHCVGWFFDFPSRDEATLWQVSSAVLTGSAALIPLFAFLLAIIFQIPKFTQNPFSIIIFTIILLGYVVSRLLLLVEAFISLRHLTLGMLALVKWTSFIPHI